MPKHSIDELRQWQSLPLSVKESMTKRRIRDWVDMYGKDGVYISFSGGKDSTVLLDIVRNGCGFSEIPAVFSDTGLEFPEIKEFVKSFDNVEIIRPKMTFKQVVEKYGYPIISKEVSNTIFYARRHIENAYPDNYKEVCEKVAELGKNPSEEELLNVWDAIDNYRVQRLIGVLPNKGMLDRQKLHTGVWKRSMFNCSKWVFMIDSPFEVGNMCCSIMKKRPLADYTKKTGRHPITAQMAQESRQRTSKWLKFGCNMYDNKTPISNPMSFWTEQDVLEYIKENNLPICSIYGSVIREEDEIEGQMSIEDYLGGEKRGRLTTTGYKRTGCVFCLYGAHLNKDQRLVKLKETHPKLYEYVMKPECQGGLGYEEKIKYLKEHGINIEY